MPWDGAGNFTRVHSWADDKANNIKITASRCDAEDNGFATGLEACWNRNGENAPSQDLPMGGYKFTNAGDATARTSFATMKQVQDQGGTYYVDSGAADAYVITPAPAITAYAAGQKFAVKITNDNTGASTLNVSGLGVKSIKKGAGANDVTAGDILDGGIYEFTYDGTNFQVDISPSSAKLQGKQQMWIPATAMTPTVSNPCASLQTLETTAGRPDIHYLAFDNTSDEHAQFEIAMPKSWNEGTITFVPIWTHQGGQTGGLDGVAWGLQGVAVSDDDTADQAYGTAVVVAEDGSVTAEDINIGSESSAITIGGTPAEGDIVFFRLFRDVSDAADDMDQDALLIGIKMFFTDNAGTDA